MIQKGNHGEEIFSSIEKKLSIGKIREELLNFCKTPGSQRFLLNKRPDSGEKSILREINQLRFLDKISREDPPTFPFLEEIVNSLDILNVPGRVVETEDLHEIRKWLITSSEWYDFFQKYKNLDEFSLIQEFTKKLKIEPSIINRIDKIINEEGNLKENASSELKSIFQSLNSLNQRQTTVASRSFKEAKKKGFVPENTSVTIKNGRMVIPVISSYKSKIGGILQDQSNSGNILYVEPVESVEISNSIFEKENEKKREIYRILSEISGFLNSHLEFIKANYDSVNELDSLLARIRFSREMGYIIPPFDPEKDTSIINGYHPVLKWNNDSMAKETIPVTALLEDNQRIILISGPNAGGKSVAIKTFGILQYLVQCCIPVPVDEFSSFGYYSKFFCVIGDEQSIDNDLSTYSSHLLNLKNIIKNANEKSLVLIDEFGSGTEPVIGGAIAEAILDRLLSLKARCLITTHYLNLKEFADKSSGISNASMRFDIANLKPLYKLELGKPGGSFALEMMNKVGFNHDVIKEAKRVAGDEVVNMEKLLSRVQRQKKRLEEREFKIKRLEKELEEKNDGLTKVKNQLESRKKDILQKAEREAKQLLDDANREIEKTIRHIKESKANKTETRKVRSSFNQMRDKVNASQEKDAAELPQELEGKIQVGDYALIKGQQVPGVVDKIDGKNVQLLMDGVSVKVKLNRLVKVSGREARKQFRSKEGNFNTLARKSSFKTRLDIRGKRAEETLPELDKFLDNALLLGEKNLTILHGTGEGVLKNIVRNHLRKLNFIESYGDGDPDRGGAGITEIIMQ